MKSNKCFRSAMFILLLWFSIPLQSSHAISQFVRNPLSENQWQVKKITKNIIWKSRQFDNLYNSPQHVSLVDADLSSTSLTLAFPFTSTAPLPTSAIARKSHAIAGINGTFFSLDTRRSSCYFKVNGTVLDAPKHTSSFVNGALLLGDKEKVAIRSTPKEGWESLTGYPNIMGAGPVLLLEGKAAPVTENQKTMSFYTKRHPRTAVGLTKNNHLLLVTVDGRNAKAYGMSLPELVDLMKTLGCIDALNMDGGGSTTLYIRGEPNNGVVNHPCDNREFDHRGERAVINAVVLRETTPGK